MDAFVHNVIQKLAIALTVSIAGVSGLSCQAQPTTPAPTAMVSSTTTDVIAAPQTAIIESAMTPVPVFPTTTIMMTTSTVATTSTPSAPQPVGTANVIPDLLPSVILSPFSGATTTTIATSTKPTKVSAKVIVATTTVAAAALATPAKIVPVKTSVATTSIPLTAQTILSETTMSLVQGLDSTERLTFTTNTGSAEKISWNPLTTTIDGGAFAVSTSCTPPPATPLPSDSDPNPTFTVRTAYDCNVSLTPQSGADRRTQSKDFDFTTDPGRLVATLAPATNDLLQDDTNNGGFTFDNQDSQPVTVTGLTVDVSFNGIATSSGLLVLRFADPATGASLYDYPLTNVPGSATGVSIPLSFTIPAHMQKALPVEAIGVSILAVTGTNPAITVTLRGVTVNDGIATKLISPQIVWSCSVPTAAYDPYATSSVFLSGQACGH